jgi:ribosome-associated protein
MLRITPHIAIDEADVRIAFVRSGGPGGQNVNKVSTAAELRFDVRACPSLPPGVRERLLSQCAGRINSDGVLVLSASRHRSQKLNRQDAVDRLAELIRRAAYVPRVRRATRPTAASRARRLDAKRRRGQAKRLRAAPSSDGQAA